ncbi:PadR family transcriptional regulator [Streptomyces sp. NPDC089799]|uniref:PadR family transcriptional regulator n=1 Tax=Streptomyces sp. NPDC089799 TaxID=3155066 RepID=UPI003431FA7C
MADDTRDTTAPGHGNGRGLPATSWAVLGLLSFGEELSGYDLKKWSDRSLRFFYWSPSFSQIYGELKRLEKAGYATSRMVAQETGTRDKRVYRITDAGLAAVRDWARETRVDAPVLKHGPMLRLWLGHLLEPEQIHEVLRQHGEFAESMRLRAADDAQHVEQMADATADDPDEGGGGVPGEGGAAGAYPALTLRWAERYYASERDLALAMLSDIERLGTEPGGGAGRLP